MTNSKTYIRQDEQGALRVGTTRVSLDSVVYSFQQGLSAETIGEQYPSLSLEEVYGAIAYYLANRKEIDRYLEGQKQLWTDLRAKAETKSSPVVERLRTIRAENFQVKV